MKITEEGMFRVVVIVGIAMVPVIALALVVDPLVGAILFGIEVGAAIGYLVQRARAIPPRAAEVAPALDDGVHRILVVANETVGGKALLAELKGRLAGERQGQVLVVVPPLAGSAAEHWSSDIDGDIPEAKARLDVSLAAMRAAGLDASGQVGDHHDPNQAIEDALGGFAADEVLISTHTPERSRWLESGVVEKARAELPQPVTHVIVDLEAEAASGDLQP
jgi:hypothetical protein